MFEPGTEVHLCNKLGKEEREERLADMGLGPMEHLVLKHIVGDPASWFCLRQLNLDSYRCALVISDESESEDLLSSDSHNLACILLLRHHREISRVEARNKAKENLLLGVTNIDDDRYAAADDDDDNNNNNGGGGGNGGRRRSLGGRDHRGEERGEENAMRLFGHQDTVAVEERRAMPSALNKSFSNMLHDASSTPPKSHQNPYRQDDEEALPVFCEILDTRTQQLIEKHPTISAETHFLISNRLISKVLAMIAEDRKVCAILNILLSGVSAFLLPLQRTHEELEKSN